MSPARRIHRDEFRAMGCAVEVEVIGGDPSCLAAARTRIEHLERCWSRFLPDSDVSRLNAAQGAPVAVDPSTIALLEAMVHGFIATDGAFDPTLLAPLVGLGYAVSWHDAAAFTSIPAGTALRGRIDQVAVDPIASVARLPVGTVVDAGGIGKGMAADIVVAALLADGALGAMVSVGGDLMVAGTGPAGGDWLIGVADPVDPDTEVLQLALTEGGVATSGTLRRRWIGPDGTAVHHLLDPATMQPAGAVRPGSTAAVRVDVLQASVLAGSAMWAEVFTKSVILGGAPAVEHLDEIGLGARAVMADGAIITNRCWDEAVRQQCIRN